MNLSGKRWNLDGGTSLSLDRTRVNPSIPHLPGQFIQEKPGIGSPKPPYNKLPFSLPFSSPTVNLRYPRPSPAHIPRLLSKSCLSAIRPPRADHTPHLQIPYRYNKLQFAFYSPPPSLSSHSHRVLFLHNYPFSPVTAPLCRLIEPSGSCQHGLASSSGPRAHAIHSSIYLQFLPGRIPLQ